jgi:hypothetical protein
VHWLLATGTAVLLLAQGTAHAQEGDPSPAGSPPAKDLPFYRPTGPELDLAPSPAGVPWMFDVLADTHGFVFGSIRGWGDETRVRFGTDLGVTLGTFNFNTFGAGLDILRFQGIPIGPRDPLRSAFRFYILLPNIDIRAYVGDRRFGVAAGTSLTGFRMANCALTGCFEMSMRVLTFDVWEAGDFNTSSIAMSLGGGLSVGIKL